MKIKQAFSRRKTRKRELLVLQVRIAGAGRPSPCVTLGNCFDLFKGTKVTDILETLGQHGTAGFATFPRKNHPFDNATPEQRIFFQQLALGTSAFFGKQVISCSSLEPILASSSGTLRRMHGSQLSLILVKQNSSKF